MMDTFTYATAATLEDEPPDDNTEDDYLQAVGDPPTYRIRAAGVLRYNRESDNHRLNTATVPLESTPSLLYPVKCEYCGEQARPLLDPACLLEPGQRTELLFCCAQRQELCEMLVEQRCTLEGRDYIKAETPSSLENVSATETEDLLIRDRGMEEYNKFILDFPSEIRTLPDPSISDEQLQIPAEENSVPTSNILRFQLSCASQKGCWTVCSSSPTDKCFQSEGEASQLVPFSDITTQRQFGLCHHQDGAAFLQKFYSSGMKFLTVFPDGSAQVFYPSGRLAVVVVTEENGRLCIVYDDSDAPSQPIRAVFQSDGRATCYHSNGKIWLSLNTSGGQCLDDQGTRLRRWHWSSLIFTPSLLHPVFLSLNKTVGVRVLGKEQVFVSFLAKGQQAKFCVGSSNIQGVPKTEEAASGASVLKEELLLLAARIRINRAIQHLHNLKRPSHPRLPRTTQAAQQIKG